MFSFKANPQIKPDALPPGWRPGNMGSVPMFSFKANPQLKPDALPRGLAP